MPSGRNCIDVFSRMGFSALPVAAQSRSPGPLPGPGDIVIDQSGAEFPSILHGSHQGTIRSNRLDPGVPSAFEAAELETIPWDGVGNRATFSVRNT
jgi:hypothetical protein